MRKLFLHMMLSLDGYIEGPNDELDWHRADEEYEEHVNLTLLQLIRIITGNGKPMFPISKQKRNLRLIETQAFGGCVVMLETISK